MKLKQKLAINYIRAQLNILALVSPKAAAQKAFQLFCTPGKRAGRKPPPFTQKGERLSFKLEGHTVRGHRWLPHQASTPTLKKVLIAHGFESTSRNFDMYIQPLLKKGYEVLAFDGPAHGQSGGKRITLPLYVKTLQTINELYGPVHSFMGHSLGGLALSLVLESLPHDSDTKLVLIAPPCEMVSAVDAFFQLLQAGKDIRKEFDDLSYELFDRPFSWYSIRRALHQVHADILWLQDEEDKITPLKDALRVKEDRHPNIEFVITKGLGHRRIYRDPAVIRRIVDFL
ncbi:MAG TPA: alpha/beta hydrolase [Puia sp.]|nr:alpha/beta hydrolase [Puia sp.]